MPFFFCKLCNKSILYNTAVYFTKGFFFLKRSLYFANLPKILLDGRKKKIDTPFAGKLTITLPVKYS